MLTDESMTWRLKVKNYFSDAWNRIDQAMYALLLLAVILRYTLTDDWNFEWARNVYAIDLVMFYVRILQFYFVEKRLGPKVIMIRRMVGGISAVETVLGCSAQLSFRILRLCFCCSLLLTR